MGHLFIFILGFYTVFMTFAVTNEQRHQQGMKFRDYLYGRVDKVDENYAMTYSKTDVRSKSSTSTLQPDEFAHIMRVSLFHRTVSSCWLASGATR